MSHIAACTADIATAVVATENGVFRWCRLEVKDLVLELAVLVLKLLEVEGLVHVFVDRFLRLAFLVLERLVLALEPAILVVELAVLVLEIVALVLDSASIRIRIGWKKMYERCFDKQSLPVNRNHSMK